MNRKKEPTDAPLLEAEFLPPDSAATPAEPPKTPGSVVKHIKAPADLPATPMELLSTAVRDGADLAVLEKLMDLRDREESRTARLAFNRAFSAFKSEAVQIIKNVQVNDGPLKGKSYANLAAVVDAVTPALSKHGLTLSWKLTKDEKDWMEVEATLRHADGHAETTTMGGPPDTGGAKNPIQARGSAKSYLERYTGLAILGLAAKDQDIDGIAPDMPESTFQGHLAAMKACTNLTELHAAFAKAFRAAGNDKVTVKALNDAKDLKKAELMGVKL